MSNAVNWFEIPTTDLTRASRFYGELLGVPLTYENFFGTEMAIFTAGETDVAGALIVNPNRKPSASGALVYLDARGDLDGCLARAKSSGGEVVMPKTAIGPQGFIAVVMDAEGNHVGLHSPPA